MAGAGQRARLYQRLQRPDVAASGPRRRQRPSTGIVARYFHTARPAGLAADRGPLCRLLWELWSPNYRFSDADYALTAASFDNPYFVEWVQRCATVIGDDPSEDIAERYRKFVDYLADHPCDAMKWDGFLDVRGCGYQDGDAVEVSGREVPFDETNPDGIYARMVGRRYYVRPRRWWNEFWRVTMLTTEAVPTRIVEAIDREAANRGKRQDDRIKVYVLGLPDLSRDTVTIELQRPCRKETLPALVRAYRGQYSDAEIITGMVKAKIEEFAVNTHMSAKASNVYIGSDIVAFYTNPSPVLFGELGALNARFGRSDLVRLFYIDQFDQTTGRNRGFRGQKCRTHTAVFPPRLHGWLAPAIASASYVGVLVKPVVSLSGELYD